MRRSRRRGVLLVLVLILVTTMFIMAFGFLSTKVRERETLVESRDSFQAYQLAYSGLETVRVRLQNDYSFPPTTMGPLQEVFNFTEIVQSINDSYEVGRYQIFCDRRWADAPYEILRVTAVGQVGDQDGNPVRHRLIAEFDLRPSKKGDLINLIDLGSY